jgi:DNA replication licensing factor MCM6
MIILKHFHHPPLYTVGQLCAVSGTVTRTSEVRPELIVGAFECEECNMVCEIEQQFKYTLPVRCQSGACQNRKNFNLSFDQSKFIDWQKARIQENANEVPAGSMPRTLEVILRHEAVEKAKPGDKYVLDEQVQRIREFGGRHNTVS